MSETQLADELAGRLSPPPCNWEVYSKAGHIIRVKSPDTEDDALIEIRNSNLAMTEYVAEYYPNGIDEKPHRYSPFRHDDLMAVEKWAALHIENYNK